MRQLKAQLALPFASSFIAAAPLLDAPLQADARAPDTSQAAAVATPDPGTTAPEGEMDLLAVDKCAWASGFLADDPGLD